MTWIVDTESRRHLSAKLAAGLAISALLAVGTFATSADARDADQQNLPSGYGGYYPAPPVVYGWPYGYGYYAPPYVYYGRPYYAPPVVYYRGTGSRGVTVSSP
jgi:hypothetical protein